MRKFISLFLSLVMLLSITAGLNLTASAGKEDVALTYGDYKYIINDDNTVNITEYTGSAQKLFESSSFLSIFLNALSIAERLLYLLLSVLPQ